MPLPCYLTIKGAKQGKIEGSCEVAGHIGEIEIQAVEHTVEIPRNPQTGQPTGQRVHGVIKLTKVLDKASPKILQALVTGEPLEEVKLAFYRFNQKSGTTEKYYTITLKDATVATGHLSVSNCLLESNKALVIWKTSVLPMEPLFGPPIWTVSSPRIPGKKPPPDAVVMASP